MGERHLVARLFERVIVVFLLVGIERTAKALWGLDVSWTCGGLATLSLLSLFPSLQLWKPQPLPNPPREKE